MFYVLLAFVCVALAAAAPRLVRVLPIDRGPARVASAVSVALFAILAVFFVVETSIVSVPSDKVGLVEAKYGFSNLKDGHFIAAAGENGYQADIVQPGTFRVSLFFNVLNDLRELPVVVVPQGFYGRVVANDGAPLPAGQVMADAWPDADFERFLDAGYFLTHGGTKGLQQSILKPGFYPLNLALFQVKVGYESNGRDATRRNDDVFDVDGLHREDTPLDTSITRVPTGSVGVVRSTVQVKGRDCTPKVAKADDGGLAAEVVPEGCKGVWSTSLPPNDYYLNRDAYDVTLVSTRVTTLEFKGGFTRRFIDLKVGPGGDFVQSERSEVVPEPEGAADAAVTTKAEGWTIPQELRAVVQITPEHAPIVVAAVGGQKEVDNRIVIPSIRSYVRNVFGGTVTVSEAGSDGKVSEVTRPTHVLDTIEHRSELEGAILALVQVDGRRAGVDVKEIRLGESAIPPELLLARQRQQLAGQLKQAYEQERVAQVQRQAAEQAKATAEQQPTLVKAQIGVQTADLNAKKRKAEGEGEQEYLSQVAAGQKAQAEVLGKDAALQLQVVKLFLDAVQARPEIVSGLTLPQVMVMGGGGLEGSAAILGKLIGAGGKDDRTEGAAAKPPSR